MFQRLMAIPQEEYLQLTTVQQARQPLLRQFHNLESQYQQQEHISDPYRKLVHQSETLDAMKLLKDKIRQDITTATPKPYQSRARSLFQHIDPILKLNERGEIFDEMNEAIPESRIEDLIQYAVRDRRRNFQPKGWNSFIKILRDHNIPKYMLNRNTLDEMESIKRPVKTEMKTEVDTSQRYKRKIKEEPKLRPQRKRKRTVKYGIGFLSDF